MWCLQMTDINRLQKTWRKSISETLKVWGVWKLRTASCCLLLARKRGNECELRWAEVWWCGAPKIYPAWRDSYPTVIYCLPVYSGKLQQPHIVSVSPVAPVEEEDAHQALWPGTHMGKIIIIIETGDEMGWREMKQKTRDNEKGVGKKASFFN